MNWEAAKEAIRESSKSSSVYIGADSLKYKKSKGGIWYARYAVVVVLHIDSSRGGRIFHNTVVERDYGVLHSRLMREVSFAADAALEIIPALDGRRMEVHLDINNDKKHASSIAVKEAIGWITGLGMDCKIKPEAWAASHCADHSVRKVKH